MVVDVISNAVYNPVFIGAHGFLTESISINSRSLTNRQVLQLLEGMKKDARQSVFFARSRDSSTMVFSNAAAKIDINHQNSLSILILEDLVISLLMLSNLDPETMSFVWWYSPRNGGIKTQIDRCPIRPIRGGLRYFLEP